MKVLVLGGTGLVGGYLVSRLLAAGRSVDVLSRDCSRVPTADRLRAIRGDLAEPSWLGHPELALASYDAVYHLAYATTPDSGYDRAVTTESVVSLVRALDGMGDTGPRHVVYLGSMAVFGATPPARVDESAPRVGDTAYATNKIDATRALLNHAGSYLATVLHPTGVYDMERSKRIRSYTELLASRYIVTAAGALGTTNIVHADDVAAACVQALDRPSAPRSVEYLINGESLSYAEWFASLEKWLGVDGYRRVPEPIAAVARVVPAPVRRLARLRLPARVPDYKAAAFEHVAVFDSSKAAAELGFHPIHRFRDLCAAAEYSP